ncbi:multiple sugar transport system substrate-binding protein [Clostridium saccharoperbutylacetonicum]|uniref:Carbohydrate ABC transporter substrate-binding protein, CUT1 family n=1 Tax=Clostridium saccharoperbutylacetonicum N1-4(HMT) TaxID=931276 RepID=M1MRX1_9CLOT|nr:ABC transporter substrate-binding protein [Clostridium saccharoperbutylacetonicum]AGF54322.1 carbohydrate ABC transporter substrate-binding protein, CUT1 family [Clostridium saccharoperbutylacetonicum N1-4(HMT)]NRT59162.1 multiple sugar transport system substrate-binding protein [Clostridium saccharoperbutylacetonicum]NSB28351.1 multiple sugar transport system substrate-binding protein [Clostridium saccharoperbutylacetonicum]NSB41839.1 multiple sugar transport system substrate-binding protei
MKNKVKYIIIFSILLVIGIISINLFQPNKEQQVKGTIEIFASEDSYDYLAECANNFTKQNEKVLITVTKLEDYSQITSGKQDTKVKNKVVNITQISRSNFEQLKFNDYVNNDKILNDYAKNFSKYRISQVKDGDNYIGIPLTSRPLALYVREDMLKTYGYKRADMNTWDDFITIGKDIYNKSNGTVKILNATGQDYEDLLDLLTMENMNSDKNVEQIKLDVQTMLTNLKNNNILNLEDGGQFLSRISSINGMRELMSLKDACEWSTGNVPSIKAGTNKFFAAEGDNLVIVNQDSDNEKLVEKFMTYIITDNDDTVKYVKQGKFFSSYLNTYASKDIEEQRKNFVGNSPLVVLSNIEEKAPEISDYDKYTKVRKELRGN